MDAALSPFPLWFYFSPVVGRDVTVVGDREGLETLRGAVGAMDGNSEGLRMDEKKNKVRKARRGD